MADVCIDARVLGTSNHFLVRGNSYGWTSSVPKDVWHVSGERKNTPKCLDTALALAGRELRLLPDEKFVVAAQSIFSGSQIEEIPWQHVLPQQAHRTFLKGVVSEVVGSLADLPTNYFEGCWVPASRVFELLQPTKVNLDRYRQLTETPGLSNRHVVESFEPNKKGYAKPVVYDRFGSRTGRLTVAEGPQILTLNRDRRDLLESEFGSEGKILMIDFNALEPRVLFYESGHECDADDLYRHLISQIFEHPISRDLVKGAVISNLYGFSRRHLAEKLSVSEQEAGDVIDRIAKAFKLGELLKRLRSEHVKKKKIQNRYGRCLEVPDPADHILINTYGQSSGVDVAMLGFSLLAERWKSQRIRPLFLVHDALVLDVHRDEEPEVRAMKRIQVPGYEQVYALKCEDFACTQTAQAVG